LGQTVIFKPIPRIIDAFYPLYFLPPMLIGQAEADARSDAGLDTFALGIPPQFQGDLLAGRNPVIQINGDATRMSQAFTGERIHPVHHQRRSEYIPAGLQSKGSTARGPRPAVEHLLVMPVTLFEIMMSKIWAMASRACVSLFSLIVVIQGLPCFPFPWRAFARPLERSHKTEFTRSSGPGGEMITR